MRNQNPRHCNGMRARQTTSPIPAGPLTPSVRSRVFSLRVALLGGGSLLATAGVLMPPKIALAQDLECVATPQVISGSSGALVSNGSSITITGTGVVTAPTGPAIGITTCDATTISNAGSVIGVTGASRQGVSVGLGRIVTLLSNTGTISGGAYGVINAGSIGALTNNGKIEGGSTGIFNQGTIDVLTNTGSISASGSLTGIYNTGSIGVLTNSGAISSGSSGAGIFNENNASIGVLTNNGTISGAFTGSASGSTALGVGIYNRGTIGTLTNAGTISGTFNGVTGSGDTNTGGIGILNTGSIGPLTNSGTISGSFNGTITAGSSNLAGIGLLNRGSIGTLTNSGTISGIATGTISGGSSNQAGIGIYNTNSIGTLSNSGTISGTFSGLVSTEGNALTGVGIYNRGSIGTLTNSGTITGTSFAIYSPAFGIGDSPPIGLITNTGVISGNIEIDNQDVTIVGGSGSVFGTLTNGTLTVRDGNLLFAGGNQLLRQDIVVGTRSPPPEFRALGFDGTLGAGTVTNQGNLMLATPQTITGSYVQGVAGSLILGFSPGSQGLLSVTGTASMVESTVAVQTDGGFAFTVGQTYTLVDAGIPDGSSYSGDQLLISGYTGTLLSILTDAGHYDLVLRIDAIGGAAVNITLPLSPHAASGLFNGTLNPVFEGGTLKMDLGGTYPQRFTLDGSPTNTIDQNGNNSVFTGLFVDAVAGVPGSITIANSDTGGSVTFTGSNTYTGSTTINAGATLALSGAGSFAQSSGLTDNGTFDISATNSGVSIRSLKTPLILR